MKRATWAAISKDSEIWKKISVGALSLTLLITTPVALGIINNDLENEARRRRAKSQDPPQDELPPANDLIKLAVDGLSPSFVFLGALCLFFLASIPVGLSYFNLYVFFRPVNEVVPEMHQEVHISWISLILFTIIGLAGFLAQCLSTLSLPVALAHYARGTDIRPALAVVPNILTVTEMGLDYWKKAAGVTLGILGVTLVFVTSGLGLDWYLSFPLSFLLSAIGFVSLVLASRHALEFLSDEFASADLPPLEKA